MLFIDLDRFKSVNDSFGHAAGDELLRQAAERMRRAVRPADTIARLGGDEFTVLCEDLGAVDEAGWVADRVSEALERPFDLFGAETSIGVSIGIAVADARRQRRDRCSPRPTPRCTAPRTTAASGRAPREALGAARLARTRAAPDPRPRRLGGDAARPPPAAPWTVARDVELRRRARATATRSLIPAGKTVSVAAERHRRTPAS